MSEKLLADTVDPIWQRGVQFPSVFDRPRLVYEATEIEESIVKVSPYRRRVAMGSVAHGIGRGMIATQIEHANTPLDLRSSRLPHNYYFSLSDRFRGDEFMTVRKFLGLIVIQNNTAACTIPVKNSLLGKAVMAEKKLPFQATVEETAAEAILTILNGDTDPEGTTADFDMSECLKVTSDIALATNAAVERSKIRERIRFNK